MKVIVLFALLTWLTPVMATSPVPVVVGGDAGIDACASLATVGDKASVVLRTGPDGKQDSVATLASGTLVHVCSASPDGMWVGVVVAEDAQHDCGVSSPIETQRPYAGPCRSGWVPSRLLTVVAD